MRIHTDLSRVAISVAPNPATSGTSLGVTDANAAYLPDTYPYWAVLVPTGVAPTRANSEIVKVTGGLSSGGTTTYTIVRAQGIPVTTAQTVTTSFDIYDANSAEANLVLNADTVDGYHANATPTASNIPVLDSAMAMITPSLYRQALINGNFDVWQRATSIANPADGTYVAADRWITYTSAGGGTLPTTITHSRQAITAGDLPNSFYHYRIAPNGAGSSLGVGSYGMIAQKVEHATRLLAGSGKKVTVSFWAKSDIANKRIGVSLGQNYGTGGTPTAEEVVTGEIYALTSSWQKFTHTFTLNTLASKTFGTDNNDHFKLFLAVMWGTTTATTYLGGGTAETYVGSGNIDIAQVQLCAGDVALPFMPKSFEEELRACLRYFKRVVVPADIHIITRMIWYWTNDFWAFLPDSQIMRTQATVTLNGTPNSTSGYAVTGLNGGGIASGFTWTNAGTHVNGNGIILRPTKTSHGLTDGAITFYTGYGYDLSAEL